MRVALSTIIYSLEYYFDLQCINFFSMLQSTGNFNVHHAQNSVVLGIDIFIKL